VHQAEWSLGILTVWYTLLAPHIEPSPCVPRNSTEGIRGGDLGS
jgi:hypothetical protein